jgi:hypothetical protein
MGAHSNGVCPDCDHAFFIELKYANESQKNCDCLCHVPVTE